MVLRYVATHDLYVLGLADLPDQVPHTGAQSTGEHGLAILRGPHDMVFQIEDRVRA